MSRTYSPPEIGVAGPWLLDRKKLEELDSLILKIEQGLEKSQRQEIKEIESKNIGDGKRYRTLDEAITYERSSFGGKVNKTINIISKDKSRLTGTSLRKLITNPRIEQFEPVFLSIDIEYGRTNLFQMSFSKSSFTGLQFKLDCYEPSIQDDLRYEVQGWIEENKPNKGSQLWLKFSSLIFIFSLIFVWLIIYIASQPQEVSSLDIYQKEITSLIEEGVNETNNDRVLELLLLLNINHVPEEYEIKPIYNYGLLRMAVLGLIVVLLGIYPPKTTIGVGKDKNKIFYYRWYIRIVLISVPTLFILTPMIDWIRSLLFN